MGGAFGAEIEEDVMGIIEKSYRQNGKLPILPLALCGVERRKNVKGGLSQDNNNKLRRILATNHKMMQPNPMLNIFSFLTLFLRPKMKPLTTGLARSSTTHALMTSGGTALQAKAS